MYQSENHFTFEAEQDAEKLLIDTINSQELGITYSFGPSRAARQGKQPCEDYITFIHIGDQLSFVVCDGVGSSFGAAETAAFLAKRLASLLIQHAQEEDASLFIQTQLNELKSEATEIIRKIKNPYQPHENKYLFFEDSRKDGGETKFFAGLLDFTLGTGHLFWLGDVQCALVQTQSQQIEILVDPDVGQEEGWSTAHGVFGNNLHQLTFNLNDYNRIIVASDGLKKFFKDIALGSFEIIEDLTHRAYEQGRDDISLIAVSLVPVPVAYEPILPEIPDRRQWVSRDKLAKPIVASALVISVLIFFLANFLSKKENGIGNDVITPRVTMLPLSSPDTTDMLLPSAEPTVQYTPTLTWEAPTATISNPTAVPTTVTPTLSLPEIITGTVQPAATPTLVNTPTFEPTLWPGLSPCQYSNAPSSWVPYYVLSGDTFYRLGNRFNIDYNYLMRVNCYIRDTDLTAGDILLVPAEEITITLEPTIELPLINP